MSISHPYSPQPTAGARPYHARPPTARIEPSQLRQLGLQCFDAFLADNRVVKVKLGQILQTSQLHQAIVGDSRLAQRQRFERLDLAYMFQPGSPTS